MYCKIADQEIPIVTTGTSPFLGAGQFGSNAHIWRQRFLNNTGAMLEILEAAYQSGARGIEAVPLGKIMEATKIMTETHDDYVITASSAPGRHRASIKELIDSNAKLIFLHGMVSDGRSNKMEKLLDLIDSNGVIPGIATHEPIPTIKYCKENSLNVKAFLIPFNSKGSMMGNSKELVELVDKTKEYSFIGMKTLAAGSITPEIAYEYISQHNICAVSIGMVSVKQAQESTSLALKKLTNY
jgi:hypothetical protein